MGLLVTKTYFYLQEVNRYYYLYINKVKLAMSTRIFNSKINGRYEVQPYSIWFLFDTEFILLPHYTSKVAVTFPPTIVIMP